MIDHRPRRRPGWASASVEPCCLAKARRVTERHTSASLLPTGSTSHQHCHGVRHNERVLVLPDLHYRPASCLKLPASGFIAIDVALQLLRPPLGVGLGFRSVFRAAMPETTMHEYGDLCRSEDEVSSPPASGQYRCIESVAQAHRMQGTSQRQLRLGIAAGLTLHPPQGLFRRRGRGAHGGFRSTRRSCRTRSPCE
jgi:hypothetical protein